MSALRNFLNKVKPNFEEGGKLHAFRSVFDGFETFLYVPNDTAKTGVNIHDAIDSKRIMSMVVIALMPHWLSELSGSRHTGQRKLLRDLRLRLPGCSA